MALALFCCKIKTPSYNVFISVRPWIQTARCPGFFFFVPISLPIILQNKSRYSGDSCMCTIAWCLRWCACPYDGDRATLIAVFRFHSNERDTVRAVASLPSKVIGNNVTSGLWTYPCPGEAPYIREMKIILSEGSKSFLHDTHSETGPKSTRSLFTNKIIYPKRKRVTKGYLADTLTRSFAGFPHREWNRMCVTCCCGTHLTLSGHRTPDRCCALFCSAVSQREVT